MNKQYKGSKKATKGKRQPGKVATVKKHDPTAMLARLVEESIDTESGNLIQAQADHLAGTPFLQAQRQELAAQIGQRQGNQHLQRLVTSLRGEGNGLKAEQLACPGYELRS